MDGFDYIVNLHASDVPELKTYPEFMTVPEDPGKRAHFCKSVSHKPRKLDFCYQCIDFAWEEIPNEITKIGFPFLRFTEIWLTSNKRTKEIGLDKYLKEKRGMLAKI